MKGLKAGALVLKLTLILLAVFIFFLSYNKFLVDHSLRALQSSLASIKKNNAVGIKDILQQIAVQETLQSNFAASAQINYAQTTLKNKKGKESAELFLNALVYQKEKKRNKVLRVLDKMASKVNEMADAIIALGEVKPQEYLSKRFKEAKQLLRQKDFNRAKVIFSQVRRYGYKTPYASLAEFYLRKISAIRAHLRKIKGILRENQTIADMQQLQSNYYQIATLYMQDGFYQEAERFFKKAADIAGSGQLRQKALFYLGYAQKLEGGLKQAEETFSRLLKDFPASKIALPVRLQIADILRQRKEFDKAAQYYYNLAKEFKDSPLADVVLFEASCVYRFDLGKIAQANKILEELLRDYPASRFAKEVNRLFSKEGLAWNSTNTRSLKDNLVLSIWKTMPPLRQILKLTEEAGQWYALFMIEGSIQQALAQKKKKGDMLVIKRTPEFLTEWVRRRLKVFLEGFKSFNVGLENFSIDFPRQGWVTARAIIEIGNFKWESYVMGRMYLKEVQSRRFWGKERGGKKWLIFEVRKAKIGPVDVPLVVINEAINKAEEIYNRKQVFRQEKLIISPLLGVWTGELLYNTKTLKRKLQQIRAYKKRFK